jgi:hypothetical protein
MAAHVRVVDVPDADRRVLQRRMRDKGVPTREVQRAPPYPRRELHVVVDNLTTTCMRRSALGSSAVPRVRLHFTPTSGSWLNLVEAFFSIITRQALHRGHFPRRRPHRRHRNRYGGHWRR